MTLPGLEHRPAPPEPVRRRADGWPSAAAVLRGLDEQDTPLRMLPFQVRFVRAAMRRGVRIAALSMARGGGKTALAGRLAALAVSGCLAGEGETILVASSHEQARLAFRDVLDVLGDELDRDQALPLGRRRWRVHDSTSRAALEDRLTGGRLRVIGSDSGRAHGLRPRLIVADEPAQWSGVGGRGSGGARLWAALTTALGKQRGSRLIAIGTRPALPEHFYSRLLDNPQAGEVVQVYAADPNEDPFGWRNVARANPGLRYGLPLREVLESEMGRARMEPAARAMWSALRLNLGVPDIADAGLLLTADVWAEVLRRDASRSGPAVWGIDLGATRSLSAIACYWPATGRLEALTACGGIPDPLTRGEADGVGELYVLAAAEGELLVAAGSRVPSVQALVEAALTRWGPPAACAADHYRKGELEDAIAGFGLRVEWRTGVKAGVEDLGRFRTACASKVAASGRVLSWAVSAARTRNTVTGDQVLAPGRKTGVRDDPAAAAVLAVGLAEREAAAPPVWAFRPFQVGGR